MARSLLRELGPNFCPHLISVAFADMGGDSPTYHYMRASMTDVLKRTEIAAKATSLEEVKYVDPSYIDVIHFNLC